MIFTFATVSRYMNLCAAHQMKSPLDTYNAYVGTRPYTLTGNTIGSNMSAVHDVMGWLECFRVVYSCFVQVAAKKYLYISLFILCPRDPVYSGILLRNFFLRFIVKVSSPAFRVEVENISAINTLCGIHDAEVRSFSERLLCGRFFHRPVLCRLILSP